MNFLSDTCAGKKVGLHLFVYGSVHVVMYVVNVKPVGFRLSFKVMKYSLLWGIHVDISCERMLLPSPLLARSSVLTFFKQSETTLVVRFDIYKSQSVKISRYVNDRVIAKKVKVAFLATLTAKNWQSDNANAPNSNKDRHLDQSDVWNFNEFRGSIESHDDAFTCHMKMDFVTE